MFKLQSSVPLKTHPYQMEDRCPTLTSPMTDAVGATDTDASLATTGALSNKFISSHFTRIDARHTPICPLHDHSNQCTHANHHHLEKNPSHQTSVPCTRSIHRLQENTTKTKKEKRTNRKRYPLTTNQSIKLIKQSFNYYMK